MVGCLNKVRKTHTSGMLKHKNLHIYRRLTNGYKTKLVKHEWSYIQNPNAIHSWDATKDSASKIWQVNNLKNMM